MSADATAKAHDHDDDDGRTFRSPPVDHCEPCRSTARASDGKTLAGRHAYAQFYTSLGWAVLPLHRPVDHGGRLGCSCGKTGCSSPAKHPVAKLAPRGSLDASRDPQKLDAWFEHGNWNIGIATGIVSGIVVLDIDPRHGGDDTLAETEKRYGPLPPTWRFLTGGGGEHIIFRHPGVVVKNSVARIGSGIDVRGDGGYIVGPPSQHIGGRAYAISVDHHPEEVPLAPLPPWLLNFLVVPPPTTAKRLNVGRLSTDWRVRLAKPVNEGQRNTTLTQLAGLLLGRHIDPHICLDLALAFNAVRCRPPLTDLEVVKTVASIARREFAGRRRRGRGARP